MKKKSHSIFAVLALALVIAAWGTEGMCIRTRP